MADGGSYTAGKLGLEVLPLRRKPRVFVSHIWDRHEGFVDKTIEAIRRRYADVQDLSIRGTAPEEDLGPPSLQHFILKSRMAARIFSSDLLIAPIGSEVSYSGWVRYEIELAAVAYSIPVILVDSSDILRRTTLRNELALVSDNYRIANGDDEDDLINCVAALIPRWFEDTGGFTDSGHNRRRKGLPLKGLQYFDEHLLPKPSETFRAEVQHQITEMHARRQRRRYRARH
ncbi:MAG: hypothetical protein FP825_18920 [Hyphomonas sp.]|uniref:TIR domain-containing protein n=1 Tax=Hyphomonas sp. TaxID=87 RepID=UPI0017BFCE54|nr:TIR domain-containing protein [Hyphomonas sp.]MBU3920993.1 TIR domain-containing protein [Alphaproteobacteria bacterium]MBA3070537.1 hypothetical protein [Hyphomonas sp.]MBU4062067.1 TIR domain-containing protein [Alphaproteobacteria bacterium]MBU4165003.1 TIR domain-containing protein [Alphaproteobacteria bacterium]MBU4569139.1 TIR domain-containing protein [Alphaproteobacteria bacterium]